MLTANQAAREKGVSRQAVALAIREGRLKAEQWGRFYMIRRKDLDAWQPVGHRPRKAQKDTKKPVGGRAAKPQECAEPTPEAE